MRSLFSYPYISSPAKFLARVSYGALWGIILSDAPDDVRLMFGFMVGLVALFLSNAFFGWDAKKPLDAPRLALYGLFVAGEVLEVGAVVLMALGAVQFNPDWVYAAALSAFTGFILSVYALYCLFKRNIAERRGSTD